jgi:protein-S-isoprenylcysteine O-methyltransferase Ste14
MTLFPRLSLGWLNGWIPGLIFYLVFFILLKIFPEETVRRLYGKPGWTDKQARFAKVGLPFALTAMVLILFTPLKIGHSLFWIGLMLFLIGLAGFIFALHTFNITSLGEPVTGGLYKFSRNPQWVTFAMVMIGISLMVSSWTILALVMVRIVMNHFRILGEEGGLELQYGASYLEYKKTVSRYFVFF